MPDSDTADADAPAYHPRASTVDLYRNPVDRNPYFPDPNDPGLNDGQIIFRLAAGAGPLSSATRCRSMVLTATGIATSLSSASRRASRREPTSA